jgi:hypothetical protein
VGLGGRHRSALGALVRLLAPCAGHASERLECFCVADYAGVVDDYDGVFQHLNLEAGARHIEIEAAGYPPLVFDVQIEPGRTITYHARIS